MKENNNSRIAVLIDCENINPNDMNVVLEEIKSKGVITIKRAFGNINKLLEDKWRDLCLQEAISIFPQHNYVSGKNTSDFSLVINAMDILYQKEIDIFVIVSSDSDFVGLVNRLREENKYVIGIGSKNSNQLSINAYNEFIYIEALKGEIDKNSHDKKNVEKMIISILENDDNNQMYLSELHSCLKRQNPDFSYKNFGYKSLSAFVGGISNIEMKVLEDKSTYIVLLKNSKNDDAKLKNDVINFVDENLKKGNNNIGRLTQEIISTFPNFKFSNYGVKKLKTFLSNSCKDKYSFGDGCLNIK